VTELPITLEKFVNGLKGREPVAAAQPLVPSRGIEVA